MPDLSGIRTALLEFAEDTKSPALPAALGLKPVAAPSDLLQLPSQPIAKPLSTVASGLFRVGGAETAEGNAGMYVVPLHEWGQRSSDRDRARRRVAKALVEYAPYGDRRWFVALTNGTSHEVEFILPRVREDKRGVSTVRALVQPTEPSGFHLRLLTDLALAPGMSLLDISRKWSEAFSVERVTKAFYHEFRELRNHLSEEVIARNKGQPLLSKEHRAEVDRFVTRQLGRMLFLWFLQEKRWLDDNRLFFEELFKRYCSGAGARNFYKELLVPLFFDTLAYPKGSKQRAAVNELFGDIPYLNGGLFLMTPYEVDLLGENRERLSDIDFPNGLFDPRLHGDGRSPTVLGLLKNYRFTTRESTPDDMSVDPDPELLGRVFENLNEERQRHDTGTYYTPREIVQFMCREALDGYLQDAAGVDRPLLERLRAAALDDEPPDERAPQPLAEKLVDALDAVKVCDPAVGSGAFLVGAMQEIILLRRGIAHSASPFRDPDASEVAGWKRHVISNALYGVDISPEAVEICQLRLWLSLVLEEEQPEPLPNLDFRIVAGDSLIDRAGEFAFEDSIPPAQTQALEVHNKVAAIKAQIMESREEYATASGAHARHLRSEIGRHQRDAVRLELMHHLVEARGHLKDAQANAAGLTSERFKKALKRAEERVKYLEELHEELQSTRSYQKPFLWPIAFPEVFARDCGGFDIVLANPPYVRQEKLLPLDQESYKLSFPQVYAGMADLLVFFYARAVQVLRDGGHLSFITSNSFVKRAYGAGLQTFLANNLAITRAIDFGETRIFDATVEPYVLVGEKAKPPEDHSLDGHYLFVEIARRTGGRSTVAAVREEIEDLPSLLAADQVCLPQVIFRDSGWKLETPQIIDLYHRLMSQGTPLGEFVKGGTYRGVVTGLNEAFVIDDAKRQELIDANARSAELIKPWLRGRDIRRWRPQWGGHYVIFTRRGTDIKRYPAILQHLEQFRQPQYHDDGKVAIKGLEPRGGDKYRKPGDYQWFEIQDSIAYYREFEHEKIVWASISRAVRFAWDGGGRFANDKCVIWADPPLWALALLNSRLANFLFCQMTKSIPGGFMELKQEYLHPFPIVLPIASVASAMEKAAQNLMEQPNDLGEQARIDISVASTYGLSSRELELIDDWFARRSLMVSEEEEEESEEEELAEEGVE